MKKPNIKPRRYFRRKKYSKQHKTSKKSNNYFRNIKRNIKIIFIFIMIIIFCLTYKKEINQVNNNNWMKKNMTEYIMNYFSDFKGNYNERVSRDIIKLREYFALKVIIKKGNLTLNLETKEKLKNELKRKTKKDFNLIKNIFIVETSFLEMK